MLTFGFGPSFPRYVDGDHNFSFAPPAGWKRKPDVPAPAVDFAGPKSGKFTTNIAVNVYATAVRPADEAKLVQGIAVKHGTVYAIGPAKLGGLPAHSWRTHLQVPEFPILENHQVLCLHGGRAVEITLTAPPGAMKKYEPIFDRLLASFRWEDAKPHPKRSSESKKSGR